MTTREPAEREQNERNDWSLFGFLDKQMSTAERFARLTELVRLFIPLAALIIVLLALGLAAVVLALAHVNVIGGYYHLTRNANELQRWGIPSGGTSVALIGMKLSRMYRRRRADSPTYKVPGKRAAKAAANGAKKPLAQRGKAIKAKPDKAADKNDHAIGEPGGS